MLVNKIIADKEFGIDPDGLQPFVFRKWNVAVGERSIAPVDVDGGEVLAVPFSKFSIELDGGLPLTIGKVTEGGKIVEGCFVNLMCIVAEERGVNDFDFRVLTHAKFASGDERWIVSCVDANSNASSVNGVGKLATVDTDGKNTELYASIMGVVRNYVQRVHNKSAEIGLLEKGDGSGCVVGRGRVRRKWKPTGVIYVGGRRSGSGLVDLAGRRLRHLAGWRVRGHWRRLANAESVGRNRLGERVVVGWTWIGEYSKGDLAAGSGLGVIRKV